MGNSCSPGCRLWCLYWCLFVLSIFPRDVLDGIWDLIGSVSEGFPTYFWWLYYINTSKQELSDTRADKEHTGEKTSVVKDRCGHLPIKCSVNVHDHTDKLPTMYWFHPSRSRMPVILLISWVLLPVANLAAHFCTFSGSSWRSKRWSHKLNYHSPGMKAPVPLLWFFTSKGASGSISLSANIVLDLYDERRDLMKKRYEAEGEIWLLHSLKEQPTDLSELQNNQPHQSFEQSHVESHFE